MKSGLGSINETSNLFYFDMEKLKFKECDSI